MMHAKFRTSGPKTPLLIGLLFCLIAQAPSSMEPESAYSMKSGTNWEGKTLSVQVSLDLAKAGLRMPGARTEAEILLEKDIFTLVQDTLFGITLDSRTNFGIALQTGALSLEEYEAVLGEGRLGKGKFSEDLRAFTATWTISLVDIAAPFIRHESPRAGPRALDFRPSKAYTGIIVLARGSLPVRGENASSSLYPCLYPRIWDDEMNVLMERDYVDPAVLRDRCMVGYSSASDSPDFFDRVGGDPLRISASAVFGTNRTDPVILREDALLILSNPANKKLITEGRVIIVCEEAGKQ